jgi:hypothetical protein
MDGQVSTILPSYIHGGASVMLPTVTSETSSIRADDPIWHDWHDWHETGSLMMKMMIIFW